MKTMTLFAGVALLLGAPLMPACGVEVAQCRLSDEASEQVLSKSKDCAMGQVCVKSRLSTEEGEPANLLCAPESNLCMPLIETCAKQGKICSVINGTPTCTFNTPVDMCAALSCTAGFHCEIGPQGPFCNQNAGVPNGGACTGDAQCSSQKCGNGTPRVCVKSCRNDGECNTNEWCNATASGVLGECLGDLPNDNSCDRAGQCLSGNCASLICKPQPTTTCANDAGCPNSQWCNNGTCTNDFALDSGPCTRNEQCATNYCSQTNTMCKVAPTGGNCASHKLKVPAWAQFGAAVGPLQGDVRALYSVNTTTGATTAMGRTLAMPAGSWLQLCKPGQTVGCYAPGSDMLFCPDAAAILLNGTQSGSSYVAGGTGRNSTTMVCNAPVVDTALLAQVMAAITAPAGQEVTALVAVDADCAANLLVVRK